MSCLPFNTERSCADCGMWTQTLYHLYGIPDEVNGQCCEIQTPFESRLTLNVPV